MRKKLPPDTRLNWRDPNMPVLRYGKFGDFVGTKEVKPDDITRYYQAKLDQIGHTMPSWHDDPTYSMRSKKRGL